jgi:hypothetical protein
MRTTRVCHYRWLEKHFSAFAEKVGLTGYKTLGAVQSLLYSHGDKAYGYRSEWEKNGIEFPQGVAIYLLTYHCPWCNEVRDVVVNGKEQWVDVLAWTIQNKDRFLPLLPAVDENDLDVI